VLLIVEAFAVAIIFYNMYLSGKEQKVSQKQAFQNALHTFVNMYIGLVAYYFIANIGLYVYIIPGLFFGVLFVMAIPAIVIEKQTVYAAFENSVRLVWGHWWQTFFALAVPYFLLYLLRNFGKFTPWEGEWVLLIDAAVLALLMPYYYAVLLVQYNNIKIIKSLPEPISHRSHH
jgi:TRAP-type C4-dicarboxylate transport system permease large subunit